MRHGTAALGYETVQLEDQSLPLLAPMSEVAGRLAVQVGGWCLEAQNGGCGVLLSGASGVRPGRVAVLGGGIAGANAARVAAGVGAEVTILDVNPTRLRYLGDLLGGRIKQPFVGCCNCLWPIVGGLLATLWYIKGSPVPATVADGAIVGLIAGLVGGLIYLVLAIPIR